MSKYIDKRNKTTEYLGARFEDIKTRITDEETKIMLDCLQDEINKLLKKETYHMWCTFLADNPDKSFIVIAKTENEAIELTKEELGIDDNVNPGFILAIGIRERIVSRNEIVPRTKLVD